MYGLASLGSPKYMCSQTAAAMNSKGSMELPFEPRMEFITHLEPDLKPEQFLSPHYGSQIMVWTQCSSVNFVFNSIILVGRNPKYWKNDTDLTQQIVVEQGKPL